MEFGIGFSNSAAQTSETYTKAFILLIRVFVCSFWVDTRNACDLLSREIQSVCISVVYKQRARTRGKKLTKRNSINPIKREKAVRFDVFFARSLL